MKHAEAALRPGGILLSYLPTIGQVMRLREELDESAFGMAETLEVLQRGWHVDGQSVRPDHRMVAHTGFLTHARLLAPAMQLQPPMTAGSEPPRPRDPRGDRRSPRSAATASGSSPGRCRGPGSPPHSSSRSALIPDLMTTLGHRHAARPAARGARVRHRARAARPGARTRGRRAAARSTARARTWSSAAIGSPAPRSARSASSIFLWLLLPALDERAGLAGPRRAGLDDRLDDRAGRARPAAVAARARAHGRRSAVPRGVQRRPTARRRRHPARRDPRADGRRPGARPRSCGSRARPATRSRTAPGSWSAATSSSRTRTSSRGSDETSVFLPERRRARRARRALRPPPRPRGPRASTDLGLAPLQLGRRRGRHRSARSTAIPAADRCAPTPARIAEQIDARGTDIYRTTPTSRDVFVLAAQLAPGDSGAPLVDQAGQRRRRRVRDRSRAARRTAYALTNDELDPSSTDLTDDTVETGSCLVG